ncbi:anthranilate synthase component I [Neisseriaceae bacterium PsAf]|nr:anthranilate synthase component I [Neisseriaceae bacterium PsAf]MCV2503692.1 anthranilate synthase component I [Neisseriaceae bacterium]
MITIKEFEQKKQEGYTHIPLVYELLADLDTPLSIYLKLANQPFSYLLESAVHVERFGRYSIIGLPCDSYIKVNDDTIDVYEEHAIVETHKGNPLDFIDEYVKRFKTPEIEGFDRFKGGLVGYFSYEINQYFEKRLSNNPLPKLIDIPDIFLLVSKEIAIVDNFAGKIYLIVYADVNETDAYFKARDRLEELRAQLRRNIVLPLSLGSPSSDIQYEMTEEEYKNCVDVIRDYIYAGDCMQVVPSRRMYLDYNDNPISLYRALRTLNPSPFLLYYNFGDFNVVGSSPELLVRKADNKATVRPLAGTRKRGQTPEEDLKNEQELLSDEKEIAEHVMLIDLGRNDVGKISTTGSVKITEKMVIERYSHVMHIVSNVEGECRDDISLMQILASTFPAGTLSGAPKIRAMEIIQELEPSKRGVYGGALGYISFSGDMDLAIGIRTAVIKDEKVYIQVGGGIVADSDREMELQETQNKSMALVRAVQMVQKGLDI